MNTEQFQIDVEIQSALSDRLLSASFNLLNVMKKYNVVNKQMEMECHEIIKKHRKSSLMNKHVRIKNKMGILLSYFQKKW